MNDDLKELYVSLCLKLSLRDDYGSKAKLRQHNRAMDKIIELRNQIKLSGSYEVLYDLLTHSDDRVRLSVASFYVESGKYTDRSVEILKDIMNNSSDKTLQFSAKMILKINNYLK